MKTSSRRVILFVYILIFQIIITGCNRVIVEQIPRTETSEVKEIKFAFDSNPRKCDSIPETGLPVGDLLENSYILFSAPSSDSSLYSPLTLNETDQIWVYDVKNNEHKMVLDNFPVYPIFGFLNDGFHFVIYDDGNLWISNIEGSEPMLVDLTKSDNKSLLNDIPDYSFVWRLMHKSDLSVSPDGKKTAKWDLGDSAFKIINNQTNEILTTLDYDEQGYISGNWALDSSQYAIIYTKPFPDELSIVYLYNANDNSLTEIAKYRNVNLGTPYWSPNGEKIVYKVLQHPNSSPTYFHVLSLLTGEVVEFAAELEEGTSLHRSNQERILWSPDSNWILFFTKRYEDETWIIEIETINVVTGEYYCITENNNLTEELMEWR